MGRERGLRGLLEAEKAGVLEGKPEAPERGRSGRADEGSGLCPRVYGAGLDPTGGRVAEMTIDLSLDCPNHRQIVLVELTG